MIKVGINVTGLDPYRLRCLLKKSLGELDPNSIVRIEIRGKFEERFLPVLRAAELRTICPKEMNVSLNFPGYMPISPDREHL